MGRTTKKFYNRDLEVLDSRIMEIRRTIMVTYSRRQDHPSNDTVLETFNTLSNLVEDLGNEGDGGYGDNSPHPHNDNPRTHSPSPLNNGNPRTPSPAPLNNGSPRTPSPSPLNNGSSVINNSPPASPRINSSPPHTTPPPRTTPPPETNIAAPSPPLPSPRRNRCQNIIPWDHAGSGYSRRPRASPDHLTYPSGHIT